MVMDLGRGNLLFPNLWGDVGLLEDDDVGFLAAMERFARTNEKLLLAPRVVIGDPMKADAYAYAYGNGDRALAFLNNPAFTARPVRLDPGEGIGLRARNGTPLAVTSWFPDRERVLPGVGGSLEVWLRPFEVLVLEIGPRSVLRPRLPARLDAAAARGLGTKLDLRDAPLDPDLEVVFADAARFEQVGHRRTSSAYQSFLPDLAGGDPSILAVAIRLSKDGAEWKYSPVVAEVVQATARVGDERVVLVPVPDARQFGNTQKAGCSWVVYRTRLPRRWSGAALRLAVHGHLPPGVSMQVGAWVVRRWWRESARPVGDGYYADSPS
jgi:hypothetical protein